MKEIINLNHLSIRVDDIECRVTLAKYRTSKTEKNYVSVPIIYTIDHEKPFSGSLPHRVPVDSIMVVEGHRFYNDNHKSLRRSIWFLDGDEEKTKESLRQETGNAIFNIRDCANKMFEVWQNRNGDSQSDKPTKAT